MFFLSFITVRIAPIRSACILLSLCCTLTTSAQWVQANGPYGGLASALGVNGSTLFAAAEGGMVYRSTDYGRHWRTAYDKGILQYTVQCFASKGSIEFWGNEGGVFRSTNDGADWTSASNAMGSVKAITTKASRVFAGSSSNKGIFVSSDDGVTWAAANAGLTNKYILSLFAVPDGSGNILAGTKDGVFISTNVGAQWTKVGSGLSSTSVSCFCFYAGAVFAGASGSVFRSTDGGLNWAQLGVGTLPADYVTALTSVGTTLYAATSKNGVYKSQDAGATWTAASTGLSDLRIWALIAAPDGSGGTMLLAGTRANGIAISTDSGVSWSEANEGFANTTAFSLYGAASKLHTGAANGVFMTDGLGAGWTKKNNGLNNEVIWSINGMGNDLFAASATSVFRSTDAGAQWASTAAPTRSFQGGLFVFGPYLIAGTSGGIYRTSDAGAHWTQSVLDNVNDNTFAIGRSGSLLFVGVDASMGFSSDSGATWQLAQTGIALNHINAFATGPGHIYAGSSTGGMFRSTNDGATWAIIDSALPNKYVSAIALSPDNPDVVFVGTGRGVFYSLNAGATWQKSDSGLGMRVVYSLAIFNDDIYAGTYGWGVWRRPLSEMLTASEAPPLPGGFALEQNYPNPFTATTTIPFSIADRGLVRIAVYDLLGRSVATVFDEIADAGRHAVSFDAMNIAAGPYRCVFSVGGKMESRLMLKWQ